MERQWYRIDEVMRLLGVSRQAIYLWSHQGKVEIKRFGKRSFVRFSDPDIQEMFKLILQEKEGK